MTKPTPKQIEVTARKIHFFVQEKMSIMPDWKRVTPKGKVAYRAVAEYHLTHGGK
jgi:hypothetical protein